MRLVWRRGVETLRWGMFLKIVSVSALGVGLIAALLAIPSPVGTMSDCRFLEVLKREAMRCGSALMAAEGASSRLECARIRTRRVAAAVGQSEPEGASALASVVVELDERIERGELLPANAVEQLRYYVDEPDCVTGFWFRSARR